MTEADYYTDLSLAPSHQPAYSYLSAKRLGEASRASAHRKGADLQLRRLGNETTKNYNGIMDIVVVSRITSQQTTLTTTQSREKAPTLQDGNSNGRLIWKSRCNKDLVSKG